MGILAFVFGIIGGLCMVMGIITAAVVIPEVFGLTWTFWLMLSANLLLISIAFAVTRGAGYE